MEEMNKQQRIQLSAMELFEAYGIEATSVNDIVQRANVAKGTFYVYFKDKTDLITQILTKQHGYMLNELLMSSRKQAITQDLTWKEAFVRALIAYYEEHADILKMFQRHVASYMDTKEHRLQVFSFVQDFQDFVLEIQRTDETMQDAVNRFILMMEIASVVSHNAIFHSLPDDMTKIKPELLHILINII